MAQKKGYKQTKEHKKKISLALKGKSKSEEHRRKLTEIHRNRSEETRKRLSESHKGKKLTEEQKKKIGKAQIGRKRSEETKMKLKLNHKGFLGHHHSEESKQKDRLNNLGKIFSEEHIKKLKIARAKQVLPMIDSKPEIKMQNFLRQLGKEFYTHQYMRILHGYQCDILIPSMNLIIECDGDFIHCNPKKYSADFVRFPHGDDKRKAKDIWERDAIRTQELQEKGFRVIRLWESEINAMELNDLQNLFCKMGVK